MVTRAILFLCLSMTACSTSPHIEEGQAQAEAVTETKDFPSTGSGVPGETVSLETGSRSASQWLDSISCRERIILSSEAASRSLGGELPDYGVSIVADDHVALKVDESSFTSSASNKDCMVVVERINSLDILDQSPPILTRKERLPAEAVAPAETSSEKPTSTLGGLGKALVGFDPLLGLVGLAVEGLESLWRSSISQGDETEKDTTNREDEAAPEQWRVRQEFAYETVLDIRIVEDGRQSEVFRLGPMQESGVMETEHLVLASADKSPVESAVTSALALSPATLLAHLDRTQVHPSAKAHAITVETLRGPTIGYFVAPELVVVRQSDLGRSILVDLVDAQEDRIAAVLQSTDTERGLAYIRTTFRGDPLSGGVSTLPAWSVIDHLKRELK